MKKIYKMRKLTVGNKTGDAYGITIPKHLLKPGFTLALKVSNSNQFKIVRIKEKK